MRVRRINWPVLVTMDICPERMNVVDAEAAESIRSEAGMALEAVVDVL